MACNLTVTQAGSFSSEYLYEGLIETKYKKTIFGLPSSLPLQPSHALQLSHFSRLTNRVNSLPLTVYFLNYKMKFGSITTMSMLFFFAASALAAPSAELEERQATVT